MLDQLREGWDYVRTFRPIRTILLTFALISLMGYPYAVLLPIFAAQILHGGAHTLGWLIGRFRSRRANVSAFPRAAQDPSSASRA